MSHQNGLYMLTRSDENRKTDLRYIFSVSAISNIERAEIILFWKKHSAATLYYTKRFNLHYYIMIIGGYIADYSKGTKPRRYCNLRNLSRVSPVNARINISDRGAEFSRCNSLNKARKVNWNTRVNKRVSSCWTPDYLEESGSRRSRDVIRDIAQSVFLCKTDKNH